MKAKLFCLLYPFLASILILGNIRGGIFMNTNDKKDVFLLDYFKAIGKVEKLKITCLNDLLKSKSKLLEDEYCFSDWLIDDGITILQKLDKPCIRFIKSL